MTTRLDNPLNGLTFVTVLHHIGYALVKNALIIDERGSKVTRNSVFDCNLSPAGRQMQLKTLLITIFDLRSSIVFTFPIAANPVYTLFLEMIEMYNFF